MYTNYHILDAMYHLLGEEYIKKLLMIEFVYHFQFHKDVSFLVELQTT